MEANDNENDNDDVARSQLDVACLMKAKNVELTVEEAVQYLRMKDSNNVTFQNLEKFIYLSATILLNQVAPSYI